MRGRGAAGMGQGMGCLCADGERGVPRAVLCRAAMCGLLSRVGGLEHRPESRAARQWTFWSLPQLMGQDRPLSRCISGHWVLDCVPS